MSKFVYIFRGGAPDSPEAGQKLMADWNDWLAGMGDAVSDPGAAMGKSTFLDAKGNEAAAGDPVSGYMVVEAADLPAAVRHAKACPIFSAGGTIEIAPTLEM